MLFGAGVLEARPAEERLDPLRAPLQHDHVSPADQLVARGARHALAAADEAEQVDVISVGDALQLAQPHADRL